MNQSQPTNVSNNRSGERGAALLSSLLVAAVLLIAGGVLIQVTSMSATNAIDTTSQAQAYYGAEAGLQAALNALRGNYAPTGSAMPAGMTTINFRNAVTVSCSNDCPNGTPGDPSGVARLSRWLPYSNTQAAGTRVTISANPSIQYDVVVSLPLGDVMPAWPALPGRLLVQATGYGPRSSVKHLSAIVSRTSFDPMIPAMMTLVGTPSGNPPMSFQSGNSANHIYSGVDHASFDPTLPAFGTTNTSDSTLATTSAASNTTSTPASAVVSVPTYLQSPAAARTFLDQMQAAAILGAASGSATYLPNGGSGTPSGYTFVNGDYTIGTGSGSGLLIVTGSLTTTGTTNFSGLILVIGAGSVNRSGGGGGNVYGAMFVANVDWPAQSPALTSFGAPFFNFSGAGTATMQYDSAAIDSAMGLLPAPVMGVSEY